MAKRKNYQSNVLILVLILIGMVILSKGGLDFGGRFETGDLATREIVTERTVVQMLQQQPTYESTDTTVRCSLSSDSSLYNIGETAVLDIRDGKNSACELYADQGEGWVFVGFVDTNNLGVGVARVTLNTIGTVKFRAICSGCVTSAKQVQISATENGDGDEDGFMSDSECGLLAFNFFYPRYVSGISDSQGCEDLATGDCTASGFEVLSLDYLDGCCMWVCDEQNPDQYCYQYCAIDMDYLTGYAGDCENLYPEEFQYGPVVTPYCCCANEENPELDCEYEADDQGYQHDYYYPGGTGNACSNYAIDYCENIGLEYGGAAWNTVINCCMFDCQEPTGEPVDCDSFCITEGSIPPFIILPQWQGGYEGYCDDIYPTEEFYGLDGTGCCCYITEEAGQCYDSDAVIPSFPDGNNVWLKGTCYGTEGPENEYCYEEFGPYLLETWCSVGYGTCMGASYDCSAFEAACYDGRCIPWYQDSDGDGYTDLDEYDMGTDPYDPYDPGSGMGEVCWELCWQYGYEGAYGGYCQGIYPNEMAYPIDLYSFLQLFTLDEGGWCCCYDTQPLEDCQFICGEFYGAPYGYQGNEYNCGPDEFWVPEGCCCGGGFEYDPAFCMDTAISWGYEIGISLPPDATTNMCYEEAKFTCGDGNILGYILDYNCCMIICGQGPV